MERITLNASSLTTFQSCIRRAHLERHWRVARPRPKTLFDSCLRKAVLRIAQGATIQTALVEERTRFMDIAAHGLDWREGRDPWASTQEWCAMLGPILVAISRAGLPKLKQAFPRYVTLDNTVLWYLSAFAEESETPGVLSQLHRWVTVDAWDDDACARALHSWAVMGDMAMAGCGMTLHVVVIGQERSGRRQSAWAKAWKHSLSAVGMRFRSKDKDGQWQTPKGDGWSPFWLADNPRIDPAAWCDQMDDDEVTPLLLKSLSIALPSEESVRQTREQILFEGQRLAASLAERPGAADGMSLPMARGACDGWVPCPWQWACYREHPAEGIGDLGIYTLRAEEAGRHTQSADSLQESKFVPAAEGVI